MLLLLLLQQFDLMLYWSFALALAIKTEFLYNSPYAKCTFDWGAEEIFNWIELRMWNHKVKRKKKHEQQQMNKREDENNAQIKGKCKQSESSCT